MRPTGFEPKQGELEVLLDDEERALLDDPRVPQERKAEILQRLEAFRERDRANETPDGANEP
ncbi:MAG TPA: hypothetical protein VMF61_01110 [Candidatus Acidoferrales bacterium]|nr:hypothetical protein [Candidatus Acidoferrales bacterium]